MLGSRISQENLQNYIELFADDIKISFIKFEEFENLLINLTLEFKNQKSSIKNTVEELKNVKLYKFDSEEPKIIDKNKTFLENCRNVINKMFTDGDNFDSDMNSKIKSYKINKDNTITRCQENTPICSNKVNLNILQSRQTNKPFIMRSMEREHKYKCRGCNQNIPTKSLFLSHLEEYPSGSNQNIIQSYHISLECLRQRGFEISYLRKSKLFSRKMTNKETIDILYEIGFKNEVIT